MFLPKEALILVLELAEQNALDVKNCGGDDMLREIAESQAEAILSVYENILDKM